MSTCFAWKFGQKRHFVYVLYLCTHEWIEYAAGHLLHISRVHARQVQKSCFFTFNYNVWVNAFCHKFVAYMSSTRCWGSCWQQQGVGALAGSNSWMERQTSELWSRCSRVLSQLTSDSVLAQPVAYFFSVGLSKQNFNFQVWDFIFSCLW